MPVWDGFEKKAKYKSVSTRDICQCGRLLIFFEKNIKKSSINASKKDKIFLISVY
jgi:hypothetical protein